MNIRHTLLLCTVVIEVMLAGVVLASDLAPHMIKFDNQSGRNAVVRVIGPTQTVAKMQRDETRTVRVKSGDYHILIRYGDSAKEYTYTKSASFSVTKTDGKFSIITFILHRGGGGTFHSLPVSGEEFEGHSSSDP